MKTLMKIGERFFILILVILSIGQIMSWFDNRPDALYIRNVDPYNQAVVIENATDEMVNLSGYTIYIHSTGSRYTFDDSDFGNLLINREYDSFVNYTVVIAEDSYRGRSSEEYNDLWEKLSDSYYSPQNIEILRTNGTRLFDISSHRRYEVSLYDPDGNLVDRFEKG